MELREYEGHEAATQNKGYDIRNINTISRNTYKGDPHDAFWYFDREMAEMTMARYRESRGKRRQPASYRSHQRTRGKN